MQPCENLLFQRQSPFETSVCTLVTAIFQANPSSISSNADAVCTEHVIHQASISGYAPSGWSKTSSPKQMNSERTIQRCWNEHELNDVNQAGLMYHGNLPWLGRTKGEHSRRLSVSDSLSSNSPRPLFTILSLM